MFKEGRKGARAQGRRGDGEMGRWGDGAGAFIPLGNQNPAF